MEPKENIELFETVNVFAGFYATRDSEPMFAYQLDSLPNGDKPVNRDKIGVMGEIYLMNLVAKECFKENIEYFYTERKTYIFLRNETVPRKKDCLSEEDKQFLSKGLTGLNASLKNNKLTIYYGGLESVITPEGDNIKFEQNSYFPNSVSYKTHSMLINKVRENKEKIFSVTF